MTLVNAFGDIALDTSVQSVVTEIGAIADASVAAGATGSLSAKLRRISADIGTLLTQTDGIEGSLTNIDTNAGATSDAAVAAGATGSISAKLRRLSTDLDAIKTSVAGTLTVGLPSGAATAAKQDSQITLLAGGLPASLGQKVAASSLAVVLASDQTLALPSGAATSAKQDSQITLLAAGLPAALATGGALKSDLTTIKGVATSVNAGTTDTGTQRVILASDSTLPLPSGAATSSKQDSQITLLAGGLPAALATGGALKSDLTSIVGTAAAVNSGSLSAGVLRVTLATDQVALTNALLVTPGGNVASGATDSGNPLKFGGKYNSTKPTFTDGQRGDLQIGTKGSLHVSISGVDSTQAVKTFDVTTDTVSAVTQAAGNLSVVGFNYLYGGTNLERQRNNNEVTLLASASRSATTNSPDQTNYNGRGAMVTINVTVEAAAETLSIKLQGKDSVSGNYYDLTDFGVIYTSATEAPTLTKTASLYPGVITADSTGVGVSVNGTISKSGVLPRVWRAVVTHSASGSWTYSVSAVTIV